MNSRIESVMRDAGFDEWGVCRYADVLPLLNVRAKARIPRGANSVIVILFGYYIGEFPNRNISYYAIVDDYHTVLHAALETAADKLRALYAGEQFIPFVDASPVAEVRAGCLAGLGDVGMNGQLLNRTYGSRCFIGEIVTTAVLEPSRQAAQPLCTRCGRCVAACPTGALGPDGFDRERCRSHITQKKGMLTDWERAQIRAGGFVWGCDRCTDACPVNRRARKSRVAAFYAHPEPIVRVDNAACLCSEKAYGWRGTSVLLRNLEIISRRPPE